MRKKAPIVTNMTRKKSSKLKDMSVDDFMSTFAAGGSDSGSEEEADEVPQPKLKNGISKKKALNGHASSSDVHGDDDDDDERESDEDESLVSNEEEDDSGEELNEDDIDDEEIDEEEDNDDEEIDEDEDSEEEDGEEDDEFEDDDASDGSDQSDAEDVGLQHKKSLKKLKDIDPEFYNYLQENDKKLLQFNVSDSEESGDEKGNENVDDSQQAGSDESDYESDEESPRKQNGVVTLKMVQKWRESLQTEKSLQTISDVVQAFHAALLRVAPEEERTACQYRVDGGAVFNAVVQMCVLDLMPAVLKYLNLTSASLAHSSLVKCKRWMKLKRHVKSYVADLLHLLGGVASDNISVILLKHIHQMTPFIMCFDNVTKHFIKKMISLWGTGEETVRVVAFMCILKATTLQQRTLLDRTLRHMYMVYIQNTKFVSPTTLPGINFMRRSLAEMFLLDETVSYHHAFLYIRQLAIHLRNAITLQKKESLQAVCNWQFVSSLALWVDLLGASRKQTLQPLLYPVVQVITGAIKLVPTAQYFPMRFHCVRLLVNLSRNTGTFIPTLPFILEVLTSYNFNRKHQNVSMKPLDFECILRISKGQQLENGFKDATVENIYSLLLECLANESHSVAFPDLAIPATIQLKHFLKECKVANYTRKLKQILDKIQENSKFIENERKTVVFSISDHKAVQDWETGIKGKGTPLAAFFSSWQKLNSAKKATLKNDTIDISEKIPRLLKQKKKSHGNVEGIFTSLPSDDSDSDDVDDSPRKVRGKRGKKLKSTLSQKKTKVSVDVVDDGTQDLVEDLNASEW